MMQTEYVYPLVGNRLSPDDWVDAGARSAHEVANDYVRATMAGHYPDHVAGARLRAICDAFPIRLTPQGRPGT